MTTRTTSALGHRIITTLALLGALLAPATPAMARAENDVLFDGERVSAFAVDTTARDLMRSFGRETGLRIRFVADAGAERMNVEIYELSLSDALATILAHRNYTVIGDRVWISSATRAPIAIASEELRTETSPNTAELVGSALGAANLANRQSAVLELAEAGTANTSELVRLLDASGDDQIRLQALRGLERNGPIDVDVLTELASDGSSQVRTQAIRLLSRRGDETSQDVLEQLSESGDALTRVAAMQALIRIAG